MSEWSTEKFLQECEQLEGELTQEDKKNLRLILKNASFKKFVRDGLQILNGKCVHLSVLDLTDQMNVSSAIKLQGEIAGFRLFLGLITDIGETEDVGE